MTETIALEGCGELRQIKSRADGTYDVIINMPLDQLNQTKLLIGWVLDEVSFVMVNKTQSPIKTGKKRNGRQRT